MLHTSILSAIQVRRTMMNRPITTTLISLILSMLLSLGIVSCQYSGNKLKPGDKIGEMLISNNLDIGVPNFNEVCTFDQLHLGTCEIPSSIKKIGVSIGWAESTPETLDLSWEGSIWDATIDGHAIDLPSFGTFDMDWEGVNLRVWNVCITNPALGKHTVEYKFFLEKGERPGNHTDTLIFTIIPVEP